MTGKKATKKVSKRPTARKSAPSRAPKGAGGKGKRKTPGAATPPVAGAFGGPAAPQAVEKVERSADRSEKSLAFAKVVARLAKDDKCQNVTLLDVRGLSPVTDYLVLATGTSGRQMRSTADDVGKHGKQTGYAPLSSSGLEGETWICVDFVDIIFHLFNAESRQYYDLEGLWGDAKKIDWE